MANPLTPPPDDVREPGWLAERIKDQVPEIADDSLSAFEKVTALRRWVRRQLFVADDETVLYRWDVNPWERSPAEIIWWSQQQEGAVFCDGFAFVAQRVFEHCGYRAATYAMGDASSSASHMVTLVEIQHRGSPMVVVQDAYFDYSLITQSGEPAEIISLLAGLRQDGHTEFRIDENQGRNGLLYGGDKDVRGIMNHYGFEHGGVERVGAFQAVSAEWDLSRFIAGEPRYQSLLEEHHDSANPLYLFLHPIAVSNNALGEELSAFIKFQDRTPA
ncbi:MAG: hypothetical protein SynsKO_30970 [Synoicihabitans sp.]